MRWQTRAMSLAQVLAPLGIQGVRNAADTTSTVGPAGYRPPCAPSLDLFQRLQIAIELEREPVVNDLGPVVERAGVAR
jgi:hypothetical protein